MRHKNILSILTKGLLTATLALSATEAAWAQGITVNTKDGKSVDYPAEQFSFMSPYIREVSTTTYTQGALATLQYEKAADLNVARTNHQVFATSAGLVVIGGHTNYVVPTETAELWQNGHQRLSIRQRILGDTQRRPRHCRRRIQRHRRRGWKCEDVHLQPCHADLYQRA